MKKHKTITKYDSEDIAEIINNMFLSIESPEGIRFKSLHTLPNVVAININGKTFLISISEKGKLN